MTPKWDLHVVLFEPEIPQNTGTIGRMCLAIGAKLHLIEPLGFEITESRVKRAGLDYWKHVQIEQHPNFETFLEKLPKETQVYLIENRSGTTIYDVRYPKSTALVFGKETTGIPDWILRKYAGTTLTIPMFDGRVRSLNLSNSVSIAAYEVIRQQL